MKKFGVFALSALVSTGALATTIGVSTHPFELNKPVITTELDSYTSNGAGTGITARFLQRVNERLSFDGAFGISNGDRANQLMVGADYEILPDFGRQPRVSVKGIAQTVDFDGDRINSFGIAPTLSKGMSFWGHEAYPFVALPVQLGLNSDESSYETSTALAGGVTGRLPFDGFTHMTYNFETNISLRNSYTAMVFGVSLPLR